MSCEIVSLDYPLPAALTHTAVTQAPNKFHLYIRRPQDDKPSPLLDRSLTADAISHGGKKMRLTADQNHMVGVQITAATDHDCSQSKLPVFTPELGHLPLQLTATACSLKGIRPVNEDQHVIFDTNYGRIFAICDGHGIVDLKKLHQKQVGQLISELVIQSIQTDLPLFLEKDPFNTKRAFEDWCEYVHSKLPPVIAGTTVAIGFYETITQLLHVATVGDTEIVVFRKQNGLIYPIPMSPKMGWDNPAAIERIKKILSADEFAKWMEIREVKHRRFPPQGGVNLAWSLGDHLMQLRGQTAISHAPMCSLLQLREGDIVLVGCDGIFDFASVDTLAGDVLQTHWDDPNLASIIAHYALNTRKSTDNVSAMVVRVGSPVKEEGLLL